LENNLGGHPIKVLPIPKYPFESADPGEFKRFQGHFWDFTGPENS
jgi:hypothetical protein